MHKLYVFQEIGGKGIHVMLDDKIIKGVTKLSLNLEATEIPIVTMELMVRQVNMDNISVEGDNK